MRLAEFVPVRREDRESTAASLEAAASACVRGFLCSFSPKVPAAVTAACAPFKKGAFVLGIDAKVPIVPVSVAGTRPY